ncbi:MAG: 3-hydroxylacyl-ACP dehydratase [Bacteroidales bacterium]|nr:3-hydroxylacyl-ACP dehydratase [Bacteroidales bacterium]
MLIKDYYSILSTRVEGSEVIFEVSLNPECEVYKGHFPGAPISPGVCSVEMIKECAEAVAGKALMITNLQSCRFLNLITPSSLPAAFVKIKLLENGGGTWSLISSIFSEEMEYVSLKAAPKG